MLIIINILGEDEPVEIKNQQVKQRKPLERWAPGVAPALQEVVIEKRRKR